MATRILLLALLSCTLISCIENDPYEHVMTDFGWNSEDCPFRRINFMESEEGYDGTITIDVLDSLAAGIKANVDKVRIKLAEGDAEANVGGGINNSIQNVLRKYGNGSYSVSQEWFQRYTEISSAICTFREDLKSKDGIYTAEEARRRGLELYERMYNVLLDANRIEKKKLLNLN